jgi:hypothetical protein
MGEVASARKTLKNYAFYTQPKASNKADSSQFIGVLLTPGLPNKSARCRLD